MGYVFEEGTKAVGIAKDGKPIPTTAAPATPAVTVTPTKDLPKVASPGTLGGNWFGNRKSPDRLWGGGTNNWGRIDHLTP